MPKVIGVGKDILIEQTRQGRLAKYLWKHRMQGVRLFIPFGIRAEVEEALLFETHTKEWHKNLREALAQRLVIRTRQKYQLERDYKQLCYNLKSFDKTLTCGEQELIALSFQHGIDIETNDKRIHHVINEVKTSPHLRHYTMRLLNRMTMLKGDGSE